MPTFRLLHASDFHISSMPSICVLGHSAPHAQVFARYLAGNTRKFDAIMVSGDLSQSGTKKDLTASHSFIFSPVGTSTNGVKRKFLTQNGAFTLAGVNRPLAIMPGNHDRYRRFVYGKPGGVYFDTVFKSHWPAGQGAVEALRLDLDSDYSICFLAADFTLERVADAAAPQLLPFGPGLRRSLAAMGQGRVYPHVLQDLVDATRSERARDNTHCVVIWVVHFPPSREVFQSSRRRALLDYSRLLTEATNNQIHLILAGHLHEYDRSYPSGAGEENDFPRVWAATTTSASWLGQQSGDFGFHIVELSIERDTNTVPARTRVNALRRNFLIEPHRFPRVRETDSFADGNTWPGATWLE